MHSLEGGRALRLRNVSLCSAHEKHSMPFHRRRDYRSRTGSRYRCDSVSLVTISDYKHCTQEILFFKKHTLRINDLWHLPFKAEDVRLSLASEFVFWFWFNFMITESRSLLHFLNMFKLLCNAEGKWY